MISTARALTYGVMAASSKGNGLKTGFSDHLDAKQIQNKYNRVELSQRVKLD